MKNIDISTFKKLSKKKQNICQFHEKAYAEGANLTQAAKWKILEKWQEFCYTVLVISLE